MAWQPGYTTANQYNNGATYDADGNLLNDTFHTYTWNMDGRPTSIDSTTLTYDAFGRMAEQDKSGTYYQIVYTPMGSKFGVYKGTTIQHLKVPLPSGAEAEYSSSGLTGYRHKDWLGSHRLETGPTHSIIGDNAYGPYGEVYARTGNAEISFTGQDSDTVWPQYDFMARQYTPNQGRWISPDPAGLAAVDPTDPQTWNRYAYVMNNPLALLDPLGDQCYDPNGQLVSGPGSAGECFAGGGASWVDPTSGQVSYPPSSVTVNGDDGGCTGLCASNATAPIYNNPNAGYGASSSGGSAANNGTPQTPQQPKPQQPCYGGNSLRDQEVRLFSLLRLAETWKEWVTGFGAKYGYFKVATAGAKAAGGEESLGATAIGTGGKALGIAGTALTIEATVADANCQSPGSAMLIAPLEPSVF